jgi:hypothetical protein
LPKILADLVSLQRHQFRNLLQRSDVSNVTNRNHRTFTIHQLTFQMLKTCTYTTFTLYRNHIIRQTFSTSFTLLLLLQIIKLTLTLANNFITKNFTILANIINNSRGNYRHTDIIRKQLLRNYLYRQYVKGIGNMYSCTWPRFRNSMHPLDNISFNRKLPTFHTILNVHTTFLPIHRRLNFVKKCHTQN